MKKDSLPLNVILLFIVKASGFLVPLASLPYLARVLGPSEFGVVSVAQSLALFFSVVIEYGFLLSATREVSRNRGSSEALSRVAAMVLASKLALSLIALGFIFIASRYFEGINKADFLIGSWLYALAIGMAPVWYFQGVEKLKFYSVVDISGKLLGLLSIFILVKTSSDSTLVLFCLAAGSSVVTVLGHRQMYLEVKFLLPTLKDCKRGLEKGLSMFIFRGAVSLYTLANIALLGLFLRPAEIGFYAAAEKLARGFASSIGPISNAVYPRVALLINTDRQAAEVLVSKVFRGLLVFTGGLALMTSIFSAEITKFAFGAGYELTADLLRLMIWIVPLIAVGNVLGIQWMLPLKLDRQFNYSVILAGCLNVLLVFLIVPKYEAYGMAWISVFSEVVVVLAIIIYLAKLNRFPRFFSL